MARCRGVVRFARVSTTPLPSASTPPCLPLQVPLHNCLLLYICEGLQTTDTLERQVRRQRWRWREYSVGQPDTAPWGQAAGALGQDHGSWEPRA